MDELLVYGYGNPGCQDDGVGILFAEKCEQIFRGIPGFCTEINYQLNVEDSYLISGFRNIIFADAALPDPAFIGSSPPLEDIEAGSKGKGFYYYRIQPAVQIAFSTHAMSPQSILGLSEELYQNVPRCHVMHITGESWEFDADPTEQALEHLENAWGYFENVWTGIAGR